MLHAGGDAVALDAPDIRHDHLSGQIRILSHIFEIPSVQRRPVNVDSGAQQDILLPVFRLFTYASSIKFRKGFVPGCSQSRQCGECRAGIICPARLVPFVPLDFGTDAVRAVGTPDFGNPESRHPRRAEFRLGVEHCDLLFQSHSRQRIFNAFLLRLASVQIDRKIAFRPCRAAGCKQNGSSCGKNQFFHRIQFLIQYLTGLWPYLRPRFRPSRQESYR